MTDVPNPDNAPEAAPAVEVVVVDLSGGLTDGGGSILDILDAARGDD